MKAVLNIRSLWRGACPLLGPALFVWVQGCPLSCPGCFNRDARDMALRCRTFTPAELAKDFLADPGALVLSGGEPFAQAPALAELCGQIRAEVPETPILAYSGYGLEHLLAGEIDGAIALLRRLDVLVDGPFVRHRPSDHPLLGSDNQRVFLFGSRIPRERLRALDRPQIQADLQADGWLRLVGTGGKGRDMHALTRLIEGRGLLLE